MRFPALKPSEMVRALKRAGFVKVRQVGSHLTLAHPQTNRMVVVPMHNRDMRRGLMMTLIKDAGFTPEEFMELL